MHSRRAILMGASVAAARTPQAGAVSCAGRQHIEVRLAAPHEADPHEGTYSNDELKWRVRTRFNGR